LQIGHAHVAALSRQAIGDPLILTLSKPHTRHLALNYPNVQVVLTGPNGFEFNTVVKPKELC
jgi:hypothetical protein